jgi:hypothetical protein
MSKTPPAPTPTGAELEVLSVLWALLPEELALKLAQVHDRISKKRAAFDQPPSDRGGHRGRGGIGDRLVAGLRRQSRNFGRSQTASGAIRTGRTGSKLEAHDCSKGSGAEAFL